jgi:hypothetical protein
VVDLVPGEFIILPVLISNLHEAARPTLEVWQNDDPPFADVALVHRVKGFFARPSGLRPLNVAPVRPLERRLMDCGGAEPVAKDRVCGMLLSTEPQRIARRFPDAVELPLKAQPRVRVSVELPAGASTIVGLKIAAPLNARPDTSFVVHIVHRDRTRILGGVAVEVRTLDVHRQGA